MKSCFAPSQLPSISPHLEASSFGRIAEKLICQDYIKKNHFGFNEIYVDYFGVAVYDGFIMLNNTRKFQAPSTFTSKLLEKGITNERPDILTHTPSLKEFYEIKPDSYSGIAAGRAKIKNISSNFEKFDLPYKKGFSYKDTSIPIVINGNSSVISLSSKLAEPGFITYQICAEIKGISIAAVAALLAMIVKEIKLVPSTSSFTPVNLTNLVSKGGELSNLAKQMGLVMKTTQAERIGWKYFWRAVAKRFAVQGAAALALAETPTPMFASQLLSLGLSIWMIIDIINLSDELWQDAERISKEKA